MEVQVELNSELNALSQRVIGAAIEVHRILGPGFLESVYEQALVLELGLQGITCDRQASVYIEYKGHSVGEGRLDLLVGNCLVVELKTVEQLLPIHQAQLLSYLKATRKQLGLLINFNTRVLREGVKRVVLSH